MINHMLHLAVIAIVIYRVHSMRSCHYEKGNSLASPSVHCTNMTIHGFLPVKPSDASGSFFETPSLGLSLVRGAVNNNTFQEFSNLVNVRVVFSDLEKFEPNSDTMRNFRLIDSIARIERFDRISKNLEKLTLRNSSGFALKDGMFSGLNNLKTLHLVNLSVPHLMGGMLKGLTSLKILQLQNLNLKSVDEDAFENLINLREFYLNDDSLESLPFNVFKPLSKLRTLVISGKKLANLSLDMFSEQKQLNQLQWPMNTWKSVDIDRIPNAFPRLHSISYYKAEADFETMHKIHRLNGMLSHNGF